MFFFTKKNKQIVSKDDIYLNPIHMLSYFVWCYETAPIPAPSSWFCTAAATTPALAHVLFLDFSITPTPAPSYFFSAPTPAYPPAPKTIPR